ncbi:MAG: NifU N-terminal domain-containing protein [Rhodothermales bacterium]
MPQIHFAPTPNPDSLKFTLDDGSFAPSGMATFSSPEEADGHPLGQRLFALPGVANVFILPQFLTVTKHPAADWDQLISEIEAVIASVLEGAR